MSKNFKMTIALLVFLIPISYIQFEKYKKQCNLMKNVAKDIYIPGGSKGEKIWTFYFGFDGDEKKLMNIESFTYQEYYDIKDSTAKRLYNEKYRLIRLDSILDEEYWYRYPVAFDEDFWAILLSNSKDVADYCKRINSLLKKDAEVPPIRSFIREFIMCHLTNYYNDFMVIDRKNFQNFIYDRKHKELKLKTKEMQWKFIDFSSEEFENLSGINANKNSNEWESLQKYDMNFSEQKEPKLLSGGSYHINLPILQKRRTVRGKIKARFLIIHFSLNKNGKVEMQESELTDYHDLEEKYLNNQN